MDRHNIKNKYIIHTNHGYNRFMQQVIPVIIVTGASDGIGKEIAKQLGKRNVQLVLVARRKTILEEVASEIVSSGGQAEVLPTDLTISSQVEAMVKATLNKFGRVDVLINVAGMGYYDWLEEQTAEELKVQFMTNVVGMLDVIRHVVPVMKKQRSGHIINFASYASQISTPPLTIYASTKYAVEGLTDGLRRELSPWNIKVTRVHPSAVDTDFNKKASKHDGLNYPYDKITGVTKAQAAKEVLSVIDHPRHAIYIAKWKFFIDLTVTINRYLPWIIDLVFKFRTKQMWDKDRRHDPQT